MRKSGIAFPIARRWRSSIVVMAIFMGLAELAKQGVFLPPVFPNHLKKLCLELNNRLGKR
ncbi:MAG: hypothetical protein ACRER2_06800 [Methylococcales bacterium]